MAKLIGYVISDRSTVHRLSSHHIRARLETWDGSIEVHLDPDGQAHVYIGDKHTPSTPVWAGNVNTRGDTP